MKKRGQSKPRKKRKIQAPKKSAFKHSPIIRLRKDLEIASSRIRRISEFASRIDVEKPDLSVDEYLSRLRKHKGKLIKETKIRFKKERPRPGGLGTPMQYGGFSRFAETYERQLAKEFAHKLPIFLDECQSKSAFQAPSSYGELPVTKQDIHHGSTYSVNFDTQYMDTYGTCLFTAELDDHASIWRDDSPDHIYFVFEVHWELPEAQCDSVVECSIEIYAKTEYIDGADDGSGYEIREALVNSDDQGEFPEEGFRVSEVSSVLLGGNVSIEILTPIIRTRRFFIRKGKRAKVALGYFGQLWAQDGLVELTGQLGTHQVGLSNTGPRPPMLSYTMDPWDPACFITTAITRFLGKSDDCYELELMRKFRDSYVKTMPKGNELIEQYYEQAPKLLGAIETRPDREFILRTLYERHLKHVIRSIERGEVRKAVDEYREMMSKLSHLVQ